MEGNKSKLDLMQSQKPETSTILPKTQIWLVKFGSSLLTDSALGLNVERIQDWCADCAQLVESGKKVIIVSSGAVAAGMFRCGIKHRSQNLNELQAVAAIGQLGLVRAYEEAFSRHNLLAAQMLLTHEDLTNRARYLNARSTLRTLLAMNVIPVINENDSVATEELRFGDNDTLAALITNMMAVQTMVFLTDQAGLYDQDPSKFPAARLVTKAQSNDSRLDAYAQPSSGLLGRGGMLTKLRAARLVALGGVDTVICDGRQKGILDEVFSGHVNGTILQASRAPISARKQWLAGNLNPKGQLVLDAGAVLALRSSGCSLLPVGVIAIKGDFARGDLIAFCDTNGVDVGKGLVNYSSTEAKHIMGLRTAQIATKLGYPGDSEIIHRDNFIIS